MDFFIAEHRLDFTRINHYQGTTSHILRNQLDILQKDFQKVQCHYKVFPGRWFTEGTLNSIFIVQNKR